MNCLGPPSLTRLPPEAAQAGSQIVTSTADMRISSQQPEPVSDGVDDPVRAFEDPTFIGNMEPDGVQLRLSLCGKAVRHQPDVGFTLREMRARPRCLTLSASSCIDLLVIVLPSPRARESSALSTAAKISARVRSRSSHSESASSTASSSRRNRPLRMACRINAFWSGVKLTFISRWPLFKFNALIVCRICEMVKWRT
jgi:hypothetical protein